MGPVPLMQVWPVGEGIGAAEAEVAFAEVDVEERGAEVLVEFDDLEDEDEEDLERPTPRPTANAMITIRSNSINSQKVLFLNPKTRFSSGGTKGDSRGNVFCPPSLYSFMRWKAGGGLSGVLGLGGAPPLTSIGPP